jgi:TnpA family transposase
MLAHATAFDATAVALQIPQLTPAQVLSGMQLFEDAQRIRMANDVVASFQRQQAVVQTWGDGKLASSDMMSMDVARQIWSARLDPRRGVPSVGTYTHVSDFWSIIYDQPIPLNERQAGAAIEGAIRQEELDLDRLAVDTHGYTEFAMGLAKLLGFDLCPRLKRLKERKFYVPRHFNVPADLLAVTVADVSLRSIRNQWDALVRIAASVETGQTSAVIALARYGSAAINDPVYRAGVHLGRLIRSLYLCDYFTSEPFRRIINRILVHGEAVHQLQRAIQMGSFSKPRGRRHEELIAMSGSLSLLTNLCLAWTTMKIQFVLDTWPRARREGKDGEWLKAVSPAHFRNINFHGTFRFPVEQYRDRVLEREGRAATV